MEEMPLQGTFDVLDFSAVLGVLAAHRMTGRLHVRSRSFAANLFFADGLIVGADKSEHHAAAVAGDVAQRAQEICFEVLDTDRGSFEFDPGRANHLVGGTAMTVTETIDQARQCLAEWQELQVIIPSLDIQPRLVAEPGPGQVTLEREQCRVLTAVDGRRSIRSIARALNMSDFEVCQAVRELLLSKVIALDVRPTGMAEAEAPLSTEQITINGKRATRVRPDRPQVKASSAPAGEAGTGGPTIVISPAKYKRDYDNERVIDVTKAPVEAAAGRSER
jgi:hypothetical protein